MRPRLPRRSAVLPFLMLAYPLVFLLYRGGEYCEPICFQPTLNGFGRLVGLLIAVYVVAAVAAIAFRLERRNVADRLAQGLIRPSRPAMAILGIVFAGFLSFFTLDSLTQSGSWQIIVLPLSLVLFFPVWALYWVTFPLAVVFSVAGIETSEGLRLVIRGIVLFVGFPLSAVLQMVFASFVAVLVEQPRE